MRAIITDNTGELNINDLTDLGLDVAKQQAEELIQDIETEINSRGFIVDKN